jgi:hypothetical protein
MIQPNKQKAIPKGAYYNPELLSYIKKEKDNRADDRAELNSTGQIKNPRSFLNKTNAEKLSGRKTAVDKQKRSVEEMGRVDKSIRDAENDSKNLTRPLIYLNNPNKLIGDAAKAIKPDNKLGLETSEKERQALSYNTHSIYKSGREKLAYSLNKGVEMVPGAALNLALAGEGAGASGALRTINNALNPLAGSGTNILRAKSAANRAINGRLTRVSALNDIKITGSEAAVGAVKDEAKDRLLNRSDENAKELLKNAKFEFKDNPSVNLHASRVWNNNSKKILSKEKALAAIDRVKSNVQGVINKGFSSNKFESKIDWGKWNEDIPKNAKLMKEYVSLEKKMTKNGAISKNDDLFKKEIADLTTELNPLEAKYNALMEQSNDYNKFTYEQRVSASKQLRELEPVVGEKYKKLADFKDKKLTPEQLIQINSKNFKKAFPDGVSSFYRGVQKFDPENMGKGSYRNASDGNVLFGTESSAHAEKYATNGASGVNLEHMFQEVGKKPSFLSPNSKPFELYNDTFNPGVLNLGYDAKAAVKNISGNGKEWINIEDKEVKDWLVKTDKDSYELGRAGHRDMIDGHVTTDDIANYTKKNKSAKAVTRVENIRDGANYHGNSSENNIIMLDPEKVKTKSLRHNNGMFDMNNPNIYKAVVPAVLSGGYLAKQNKKESKKQ